MTNTNIAKFHVSIPVGCWEIVDCLIFDDIFLIFSKNSNSSCTGWIFLKLVQWWTLIMKKMTRKFERSIVYAHWDIAWCRWCTHVPVAATFSNSSERMKDICVCFYVHLCTDYYVVLPLDSCQLYSVCDLTIAEVAVWRYHGSDVTVGYILLILK